MKNIYWSKKIFGNKMTLTAANEQIGYIEWRNFFSSKAYAVINGRRYILGRDFMLSKIEVQDASTQLLLASVVVNLFNTRSDVLINGKRFELVIKNFWDSGWSWKFDGVDIVRYRSNEFLSRDKGQIELDVSCNEEIEVLMLLGLFIRFQFVLIILLLALIILLVIV